MFSDADWASFASLEQLDVVYDAAGRRVRQNFTAGGATHAVTQYAYDTASRLDCVAVRMNASEFGALPASACTLDTEGAHGADRITRYFYDNGGRISRVANGYGTSAQQDALTQGRRASGGTRAVSHSREGCSPRGAGGGEGRAASGSGD